MPLFEFYSVEKRDIIRKQFEYVTTHGELELYCFKKDANDKESMAYRYATLFVKVSQTQVIMARFNNFNLENYPDRIPTTMQQWKSSVAESIQGMLDDGYIIPGDSWYFGFTDEQRQESIRLGEEKRKKKEEERQKRFEEQRQEEERKRLAYIESAKEKIRKDIFISGEDLLEVARSIGIDVHPRTVSVLRKKVYSINSYTGSVCRSLSSYRGARLVYKQVKECLTEQE